MSKTTISRQQGGTPMRTEGTPMETEGTPMGTEGTPMGMEGTPMGGTQMEGEIPFWEQVRSSVRF